LPLLPQTRNRTDTQLVNEALALQAKGRLLEAEALYQAVLRRTPGHGEANNGMGVLAISAGRSEFAIGFFEKAVAARPGDFRFLNNLGNVFMNTGRTEEGLPYLEKALKLRPSSYELLYNIGRAYQRMGLAARGIELLEKAIALRPDSADAAFGMADALSMLGNNDEAEKVYRRAQMLGTPLSGVLSGIAAGRKQTPEKNILGEIEVELAKPATTAEEQRARSRLHFAAAKTLMDLKRPDDAWQHLSVAHATAPKYDMPRFVADVDATIALFNPAFMKSREGFGSPSEQPVFIVGMPRSGTSLTEQILSSHPEVYGAGELTYLHTIANQLFISLGVRELFSDRVRALTRPATLALANSYLAKTAYFSSTAARITDKMPHNFLQVGLIALLFPKARVIFCRRDPLDNCFSIFSNPLNDSHSYSADLGMLGHYYRQHIRLMEHWKALLPGQVMELRYEALVDDLEGVSRRMVDFVGLEWDDACLSFFDTERTVSTISKWQVRQPIYRSSVERWRPYDQYLGPLKQSLGDLLPEALQGA